jgi:type VI secretion system protein ImpA
MLDVGQRLTPVNASQRCGADLAFSAEIDAIARARQADEPSLEQGA